MPLSEQSRFVAKVVPPAIANRVLGKDALKSIIACLPKPVERRREEPNEVLAT